MCGRSSAGSSVGLRLQRPEVRIPPAAPRAASLWMLLFLFCMRFYGMLRGGVEQPVPAVLRPGGQKSPCGAFLGRGLANPPGRTKGSTHSGAAFFILYEILRDAARGDSNSCKGDRRLRRSGKASSCLAVKIAFSAIPYSGSPFAGASVVAAARQGRGRRGQAPPKGRRPMRAPQPVQCPPSYVPAGKKAPAGLF